MPHYYEVMKWVRQVIKMDLLLKIGLYIKSVLDEMASILSTLQLIINKL